MKKLSPLLVALLAPAFALAAERDLSQPINTVCPVDGMVVDRARDPIVISDTTGSGTELVPVGVCDHASCAEAVRTHPEDYLQAARHDRIAKVEHDRYAAPEHVTVVTTQDNPGKAAHPADRDALHNGRPNALEMTGKAEVNQPPHQDVEKAERR